METTELRELLTTDCPEERVREILGPVGFSDLKTAHSRLLRLAGSADERALLADTLPMLLSALSDSGNPDQALVNFERFGHSVSSRKDWIRYLGDHPRAVEILVRVFVGSQFLTEILLCNPGYLEELTQYRRLADLKSQQQFYNEARASFIELQDTADQLNALRRFQRWEMLRIGACDFFGLLDLRRVTVQLSLLADSMIRSCLDVAYTDSEVSRKGFCVIAMGKLGGEELNYSSDIDLLFLCESNASAHWRIGQRLIKGLTDSTADGFLYRVDMRLRPWGRAGELVSSLDSHIAYVSNQAQLWEKQALLKARVVAGDPELGAEFLRRVEPLLFNASPEAIRESVSGMKRRIEEDLQKKGRAWGEVKLGEGSIRDVEFAVQYLQLVHGGEFRHVRSFNTLDALVRLADAGFLHGDEYRVLTDGYIFQRTLEHSLQLMHNKQTHELPTDPNELSYMARRLDYASGEQLLVYYRRHCAAVRAVYERYLGAQPEVPDSVTTERTPGVSRHLSRMERSYSEVFSEAEIEHHAALAEHIDEKNIVIVEAKPEEDEDWRVTIVGYDYAGELSLICGLLLVHGCNIVDGQVFTYEPLPALDTAPTTASQRQKWRRRPYQHRQPTTEDRPAGADRRQKIVDVFRVRPIPGCRLEDIWQQYTADLTALLQQSHEGKSGDAQGALVKRVAAALEKTSVTAGPTLYPIEIEIDNSESEQYTVLRIRTHDTLGFLYELTNALALNNVYISRLSVDSTQTEICDTLFVTDENGRKITDPAKQRELKAATVLTKHFTHILPRSSNPQTALLHFREFVTQLFTRPDWADEIVSLERSEVLDALARLLGVSDFLWNDFLRMQHANLFPVVRDVDALAAAKTKDALAAEINACLQAASDAAARRRELNAFKDREMFRVDMRHILGNIREFGQFSTELTDVAEVVVNAACRMCDAELRAQHGDPLLDNGAACPLSVCALGKCGGREIGFASDIELMFIYAGEGKSTGPQVIATSEYFVKLVIAVTHAIEARREGIFEIDLRLRPYGRAGSKAVSLDAFAQYFAPDGAAWPFERQALVKLRPIVGDPALGARIVQLRDKLIYTGEPFDIVAMRGMRERQIRQLVTPGTLNAKLSPGGLVDIEYLVQGLQIMHGHTSPGLHAANTIEALAALAAAGFIQPADADRLSEAYDFLRKLIGALRIVRGNAKDLTIPPADTEEFAFLARRLGYEHDLIRLSEDVSRHMDGVRELQKKLLD